MRLRVYIASPLAVGDLTANVRQATDAAAKLIKAGYSVLCPQLSVYLEGPEPKLEPHGIGTDQWMDNDLPFVAVCDLLLRLPGESRGADLEVQTAEDLNIPVYHSLKELLKWGKTAKAKKRRI